MAVQEEYIVFKGDEIRFTENTLEEAEKKFNTLPPPKLGRKMNGRAIYKLIKED